MVDRKLQHGLRWLGNLGLSFAVFLLDGLGSESEGGWRTQGEGGNSVTKVLLSIVMELENRSLVSGLKERLRNH